MLAFGNVLGLKYLHLFSKASSNMTHGSSYVTHVVGVIQEHWHAERLGHTVLKWASEDFFFFLND